MDWYITPDEVKAFTLIDEVKNMDEAIIQSKIELAQFKIEAYCNQFFYKYDEVKEISGMDSNLLTLPERICNINSVFFDYRNTSDAVVIANDGWGIRLKPQIFFNFEIKDKDTKQPVFPQGVNNIIVDGTWGWKEVPREVVYCMKKLTEGLCLFAEDEEAVMAETGVFKKQTIGSYSYELKDAKLLTETQSTGDATVDTLLKKYKRSIKKSIVRVGVI